MTQPTITDLDTALGPGQADGVLSAAWYAYDAVGQLADVLARDEKGRLLWASPALAGAVHDVRAAREHGITDALAEVGITCWADKGTSKLRCSTTRITGLAGKAQCSRR